MSLEAFQATTNDPGVPPERCFRSEALDRMSDAAFARLSLAEAEALCLPTGSKPHEQDALGLGHVRYVNELRRRLRQRTFGGLAAPDPVKLDALRICLAARATHGLNGSGLVVDEALLAWLVAQLDELSRLKREDAERRCVSCLGSKQIWADEGYVACPAAVHKEET